MDCRNQVTKIFSVLSRETCVVKLEAVRLNGEVMNVGVFFDIMIMSG